MVPAQENYSRAFDHVEEAFDRLDTALWGPVSQETVALSDPRPGEHVLDACCGNGASALPAARRVGPTGTVWGVDTSERQIRAARDRCAAEGLGWARFTVADATALPPRPFGYDLVQCVLGIFFFPEMTTGTEHLLAQARPGGRVALTIWQKGAMETVARHLIAAVEPIAPAVAEAAATRAERAEIYRIDTPPVFTRWLEERGLEEVAVTIRPYSVQLTDDLAWDLVIGSGFRALLADLGDRQVEQVRKDYLERLHAHGVGRVDATTLVGMGRTRQ